MPSTYTLIASNTLASTTASVTFSGIPQTYTDLFLVMSAKHTVAGVNRSMDITINGNTSSIYTATVLYANGSSSGSFRYSGGTVLNDAIWSNSNYNNAELYIPSYTTAINKPISFASVGEVNSSSGNEMELSSGLFGSTSAVTSIAFTLPGTSFSANSSFYLYGIKNS